MEGVRNLGEREAEVMEWMWRYEAPATVREVLAGLAAEPPLAYTTVLTILDNLHKKGLLTRTATASRGAFRYLPSISRADYVAARMRAVLQDTADQTLALTRFVDGMSADQADALRAALADYHRRAPQ